VLVSAGMGVTALGLAGTAQAVTWCPGDGSVLNKAPWPDFDWTACHHWHYAFQGAMGNVDDDTGIFHPSEDGPPVPPSDPSHGAVCIGTVAISGPAWQCAL
jgi:hypothetical protein